MTKNNDGRKHWRFGRIYEKEQAQLWNFLRKAWENFGATVAPNFSEGEKRRPEMRLLFAGYPQTDLLTELEQWGIKMLFSLFTWRHQIQT